MSQKKKTQEQLFNRILINIGIAVIAYILLYILYAKFYLAPAIPIGIAFIVIAVIGYIVSGLKLIKVKNYAHMFLAFGLCLLFTRLSVFAGTVLGMEKFIELINTSGLFKMIRNSRYEVIFITWLGAAYLAVMLIYNTVMISRAGKKSK